MAGDSGKQPGDTEVRPVDHPTLPLLLNADEAAELLRTTRTAAYAMLARGSLPGVTRIGRRVLIRSDALLNWLDQKSAPSRENQR